jgi:hypothetical protein
MPKLLISYFIQGRRTAPFGQRIWESGVAETYQTTRRVKGEDGEHRTVSVPPDWYQVATLSEAQLEALRLAIAEAHVGAIPTDISKVDPAFSDVSSAVWQVAGPGGLREIRVAQWGRSLDEAARPLLGLVTKMGMLVAMAAAGLEGVPD